ncbi:PREDICTED: transmembrane protein 56-B-like [Populus euphratica]|uniref:Transmembrane protein 56-B-like n=1 Tax=Populus euphratica TaxID=75702 RepID=A0AAJ6UN37_POPEU|nr:PREDICTED: transmembrane protein 56-B-like [Populus euphratica]
MVHMQGSDGMVLNLKSPSLYIYIVDGGISLLANNLLMVIPVALSKTYFLQVSAGYFIADLGMIIWFYPSLGGVEYVIHHFLSLVAVAYSMLTGEGQLYTYMVLISETTTPGINLRWYLDTAGMKKSKAYLLNGVVIFFAWFVARILLFIYLFYHVFLHLYQVKQMHSFGRLLALVVPVVLSVMNLMWFWKIFKGMKKTLAKRH